MSKKKRRVKEVKYSERVMFGLVWATISAAALLALFSVVILNRILDFDASIWIAKVVNFTSAMVCGITVAKKGEGNIIKCGLLPGIIFGFIIIVLSMIINFEGFSMTESLKTLLISAAGSTTGGILSLCTSNKKCHK